jgi:hypothetical protein
MNGAVMQKVEERPSAEGRRFGMELETHTRVDIDEVIRLCEDRGLKINDQRSRYFKSDGAKWDIKRDGSCGYEFASPILSGAAGIFDAKIAVEKIREVCPTAVNSDCGIHVTIDVSDHSPADLKRLLIDLRRDRRRHLASLSSPVHAHRSTVQPARGIRVD